MIDDNPCHFCTERTSICHGVCKRYKVFADNRQRVNAVNRAGRMKESLYSNYMTDKITNMKKGNYRRGKKTNESNT
jgi:hypothetical protein